jgi:hypothetical protein
MRTVCVAVALCALGFPSPSRAQEVSWEVTVVGFSRDQKVALVRWQEHLEGDESTDAIAIVRLDLAARKWTQRHDIVTRSEIRTMKEADYPRLRGQRWTELEKQLKKEGFTVEPKYKALARTGPDIGHGSFALPGGIVLEEACVPGDDYETCDLVAKKGGKTAVLEKAVFKQMPSVMSMDFLRRAYLDPKSRYVVAIDRWTPLESEVTSAKDPQKGLRVFEISKIEAALK